MNEDTKNPPEAMQDESAEPVSNNTDNSAPVVPGMSFSPQTPLATEVPIAQPQLQPAPALRPMIAEPGVEPSPTTAYISPLATVPVLPPKANKKSTKSLPLFVGAAAAIMLLAAAFFFLYYLPNTPLGMFSTGLTNTGKAVDLLINYSQQQEKVSYASDTITGSFHTIDAGSSGDVNFNAAFGQNGNGTLHFDSDELGEKFSGDFETVKTPSSNIPDAYFRLTGIKSILDSLDLSSLDNLDGQWIAVDHTVTESFVNNLDQLSNNSSSSSLPSYNDVQDAINKVQAVNNQYLFTSSPTKSIVAKPKFVGTDTANGDTLNHYKVTYNKAHLQAYITAVGQALDSSKLNAWAKNMQSGSSAQSISQALDLDKLKTSVQNTKSTYTFDLWIDKKTKLVSKVSFANLSSSLTALTIGQNYTSGNQYPFTIDATSKDDDGSTDQTSLNVTLDTTTNKLTAALTDNTKNTDGSTTKVNGSVTFTPSKSSVNVTAPASSKPIMQIFTQLGLNDLNDSTTDSSLTPSITTNSTSSHAIQTNANNIRQLLLFHNI